MLALSCTLENNRHSQFLNSDSGKLQPHIKYVIKHNTENDDIETLSLVMTMLAIAYSNNPYITVDSIKDITLYNAKNKNISKCLKTSEIERFRQYFPISFKFGKALKDFRSGATLDTNNTSPQSNIQSLISSTFDDGLTFPPSGDAEQDSIQQFINLTLDYSHSHLNKVIMAYMKFDDKDFIVFPVYHYDDIQDVAGQFKSLGFYETCSKLEHMGIMAVNDKMMFNLKMSLQTDVYDSITRINL